MHLSQIHNPSHPPTNHCGLIIHIPSLSSPLLLRNYPNTFAFIPLVVICLSSLNRSNSKAFCPILPCIAPVCESMHYHKTGVPWQIKSTRITNFSYLKMPCNAKFCMVLSVFSSIVFFLFKTTLFHQFILPYLLHLHQPKRHPSRIA